MRLNGGTTGSNLRTAVKCCRCILKTTITKLNFMLRNLNSQIMFPHERNCPNSLQVKTDRIELAADSDHNGHPFSRFVSHNRPFFLSPFRPKSIAKWSGLKDWLIIAHLRLSFVNTNTTNIIF
jgi:hypothetical protein